MKKYNLVIKESIKFIGGEDFPTLTTGNRGYGMLRLLRKKQTSLDGKPFAFIPNMESNKCEEATMFTQQEIDELPYDFVKLFGIIEVKEELYYIKMPYSDGAFLNQDTSDGEVIYSSGHEIMGYQTKFTLDYIKKTFPLFVDFAVKVEEEK